MQFLDQTALYVLVSQIRTWKNSKGKSMVVLTSTKDWEFETPLIKAVKAGNPGIVAQLLDSGADVFFEAFDGTSAVSIASVSSYSNAAIARLLLRAGHHQRGSL
jgi:ankyrin repeat protein